MPVTRQRARELALALENVSSKPHFDRTAFHTPRRTFATLALNGTDMNFMFDHAEQQAFCERAPEAMAVIPGGWGRMGWTSCDLKKVDAATFRAALQAAHARANAPRPTKAKKKRPN